MHNASVLAAHFSPRPFGQLLGEEDGKGLFGVRLHNEVSCERTDIDVKNDKKVTFVENSHILYFWDFSFNRTSNNTSQSFPAIFLSDLQT